MTTHTAASKPHPSYRVASRPGSLLLLFLVLLAALTITCGGPEPTLEERAYALDRQLMCPVCDGQTVDQSNAQVSLDMKSFTQFHGQLAMTPGRCNRLGKTTIHMASVKYPHRK